MDSVTHIFLGGAIAQAVAGRRVGFGRAFVAGALAATLPDFDTFVRTGDEMRDLLLHRHFMHSLVMVPVLAVVAVLPFLLQRAARRWMVPLYLAALLACVSHALLDTLTSYGTMIFWPFSERRYALDIVAVVDPLYTVPLMVGVIVAWKRRAARLAGVALAVSCLYLGLAFVQHGRAAAAQRQLVAARHVSVEKMRVLPQVGAVISYRSIYVEGGVIQADAIRVPFFGRAVFKAGGQIPLLTAEQLGTPAVADVGVKFAAVSAFFDGYVARYPGSPLRIADERYAYEPQTFESVWSIQLEGTDRPIFEITPRWKFFGVLLRDLVRPRGYGAIPEMP